MLGYQPGVGFYAAALLMAALCMLSMSPLHRLEVKLPGRATLDVSLTFRAGSPPNFGYRVLRNTLTITPADNQPVWRFNLVAMDRSRTISPTALAMGMVAAKRFSIISVRN